MQHDSFVARAAHDATFKYLVEAGITLNYIVQFCDNCGHKYKSKRPFAELARHPLKITRVYFGENHGKSQCDGFFGRLKDWMIKRIKARHVNVENAEHFYRYCDENYPHKPRNDGSCQHYQVVFQHLRPGDIRRHHDCSLEKGVPGTRKIFNVRNTPEPLKLQVRNIPCICPACIEDGQKGGCGNPHYVDEWREVPLEPVRGDNLKKHQKRPDPRSKFSFLPTKTKTSSESDEENVLELSLPNLVTSEEVESNYVLKTTSLPDDENDDTFISDEETIID